MTSGTEPRRWLHSASFDLITFEDPDGTLDAFHLAYGTADAPR